MIVVGTKKCLGGKSHSTVDRHNMMEGSALRDEEIKIRFPIPRPTAHPHIIAHWRISDQLVTRLASWAGQ